MNTTNLEVLDFIRDNDVKFIRLAFCDLFGVQKNISILPSELKKAFEEGISFDASAIKGFSEVDNSDLLLVPDSQTLSILPWRPQQGRVVRFYCNIFNTDGTPFVYDSRNVLVNVLSKLNKFGYSCKIGSECEFYLFKTDENQSPTLIPFDNGTYFDVAPIDKGENVRREICLTLEEMGLFPETSHHEHGPGQNEIDFKFSDALTASDNIITFKSVVKVIAARNGLFASFMPKPIENESGNGLHINLSLSKNGKNVFEDDKKVFKNFVAGLLNRSKEITLFTNPIVNSYERLGSFEAPKYISYSKMNRSQLIRIPFAVGESSRLEYRAADSAANPYLALALIINAGLEGIMNEEELTEPVNANLFTCDKNILDKLDRLPDSLKEAIEITRHSSFVEETIGKEVLSKFIKMKEEELTMSKDKMFNKYFTRV